MFFFWKQTIILIGNSLFGLSTFPLCEYTLLGHYKYFNLRTEAFQCNWSLIQNYKLKVTLIYQLKCLFQFQIFNKVWISYLKQSSSQWWPWYADIRDFITELFQKEQIPMVLLFFPEEVCIINNFWHWWTHWWVGFDCSNHKGIKSLKNGKAMGLIIYFCLQGMFL